MHLKTSFAPISFPDTTILILGSMPGDRSLELSEYYGHKQNRFWSMLATLTNNPLPLTYPEKKELLFKTRIGVWDVAHTATRIGSLDSAMRGEVPNDLDGFIARHPNLKVIAFNGKKAEALFNKYFTRKEGITYLSMPSTSPANAGINLEQICQLWRALLAPDY
jgi:hypoxanthine-DNA glycosylase